MNEDHVPLSNVRLRPGTSYNRRSRLPRVLHPDDPALPLMTDFSHVLPVTTTVATGIETALLRMKNAGVRLLLVIDDDEQVIGLISSYDIQGERPVKLAQESRIQHVDITVGAIMIGQAQIRVIDMLSVRNAQISHIVATMSQLECRHLLVVDVDPYTKEQTISGLFSATQISKHLHIDVTDVMTAAHSLAELQHERLTSESPSGLDSP